MKPLSFRNNLPTKKLLHHGPCCTTHHISRILKFNVWFLIFPDDMCAWIERPNGYTFIKNHPVEINYAYHETPPCGIEQELSKWVNMSAK